MVVLLSCSFSGLKLRRLSTGDDFSFSSLRVSIDSM